MSTLARPKWRDGQVLHPKDLRALEAALAAEAALRGALDGLPAHGVIALEWRQQGRPGMVGFEKLAAVFPLGTVVELFDNADMRAAFDLSAAGRSEVDVYLHLVDPPEDDEAEEDPPVSVPGGDVARSRHLLALSPILSLEGSLDHILIGRFVKDDKGSFAVVEVAVPPLLRVDASPLLVRRLAQLRDELGAIEQKLDAIAADAVSRGLSLMPTHRVRIASRRLGALLADRDGGVRFHPYPVFAAIRDFALELSALDEMASPRMPAAYNHDHPWASFSAALDEITWWVSWSPPGSPRVEFRADDACRLVAALPDDALSATEMHVVVLKRDEADKVPFDQVCLASPSRLRLVREYVLKGVRVTRDASPSFRYGFGAGTEFYRVEGAGDEWKHVLRDKALAFHPTPALEGQRFVLCWRPT